MTMYTSITCHMFCSKPRYPLLLMIAKSSSRVIGTKVKYGEMTDMLPMSCHQTFATTLIIVLLILLIKMLILMLLKKTIRVIKENTIQKTHKVLNHRLFCMTPLQVVSSLLLSMTYYHSTYSSIKVIKVEKLM